MGRPSNTDERRRQIVEGLLEVLARGGMRAATTQAIADAAGLSPGLVHYHFKRKRDVLLALLDELLERLTRRATTRAPAGAPPRAALHAWLDAALARGGDEDPRAVACWVALAAEAASDDEVREVFEGALARIRAVLAGHARAILVEEGLPAGAAAVRAEAVATSLLAWVLGAFLLAAASPSLAPPGFAAPLAHDVADKLLGAPGTSA